MKKDDLCISNKTFSSRLLVGTGKYKDEIEALKSIEISGAEIVTVAVRRIDFSNKNSQSILDFISPDKFTILPNTAGSYNVKDAVRMAKLGREILGGEELVKLEVLNDPETLLPNMDMTIKAAEILVKENFDVMVYCTSDYESCKKLEDLGCVSIMPLAAPIGSGLGIIEPDKIQKIIDSVSVPVIIDAGIGTASDASIAMEMGADAVLLNTAIAKSKNPLDMAMSMKLAVQSGRLSFKSGRIPKSNASPSSPLSGIIES